MKLFFKHLLRSIKKRPLQPIILMLTITLSLIVCSVSVLLGDYFLKEVDLEQTAHYGNADIEISIDSKTKSRFMFSKTVKEVLGDQVKAVGRYEAPMFIDGKNGAVSGVAVNFDEIGDIFDIEFLDYGEVRENTVNKTAFISERFHLAQGLNVGDKLKVKTFGENAEYTVQGIMKTSAFADCDVLVSISSIMRLLSKNSLAVSALGEDFLPCNTIYVNVGNKDVDDCINLIKSHREFNDKSVVEVKGIVAKTTSVEALSLISGVLVVVSCIASAAVTFSCLYILSSERTEENQTFYIIGAKKRHLNLLQYAETVLYWLVGVVISNAVISPIMRLVVDAVGFNYVSYSFSIGAALKSGGAILLSSLITVTAFITLSGKTKKKRSLGKFAIILSALITALMLCYLVIPSKWKLTWSITCNLLVVLLVIVASPIAFTKATAKIERLIDKRAVSRGGIKHPTIYYGVKNVKNVKVMHNTARLAAITTALVMIILIVLLSTGKTVASNSDYLSGSYAVVNATDRCYEKVMEKDSVKAAYTVGSFSFENEYGEMQMLSVSDLSAFNPNMEIERLPEGNEVYLSKGAQREYGVDIGDEIVFYMADEEYVLKYAGTFETNVHMAIFDSTEFNLERNMLFVVGEDDVTEDQLYADVSAAVALEMSTVIDAREFIQSRIRIGKIFYNGVKILFPVIVGFVIIGIVDNLLESYRTRKDEFELYSLAGMSKKQIRRVKAVELIITFGLGIIVGLAVSALIYVNLDQSLINFSYNINNAFS